jgi:hypothetical protein
MVPQPLLNKAFRGLDRYCVHQVRQIGGRPNLAVPARIWCQHLVTFVGQFLAQNLPKIHLSLEGSHR